MLALIKENPLESFNMGYLTDFENLRGTSVKTAYYCAPKLMRVVYNSDDSSNKFENFPDANQYMYEGIDLAYPDMRFITPPTIMTLDYSTRHDDDISKMHVSWFNTDATSLDVSPAYQLMSNVYQYSNERAFGNDITSNALCSSDYVSTEAVMLPNVSAIENTLHRFFSDLPNSDLLTRPEQYRSLIHNVCETLDLPEFKRKFDESLNDYLADVLETLRSEHYDDEDYDEDDDDETDAWFTRDTWQLHYTGIYSLQAAYFKKYHADLYDIPLTTQLTEDQETAYIQASLRFWDAFLSNAPILDADKQPIAGTPVDDQPAQPESAHADIVTQFTHASIVTQFDTWQDILSKLKESLDVTDSSRQDPESDEFKRHQKLMTHASDITRQLMSLSKAMIPTEIEASDLDHESAAATNIVPPFLIDDFRPLPSPVRAQAPRDIPVLPIGTDDHTEVPTNVNPFLCEPPTPVNEDDSASVPHVSMNEPIFVPVALVNTDEEPDSPTDVPSICTVLPDTVHIFVSTEFLDPNSTLVQTSLDLKSDRTISDELEAIRVKIEQIYDIDVKLELIKDEFKSSVIFKESFGNVCLTPDVDNHIFAYAVER